MRLSRRHAALGLILVLAAGLRLTLLDEKPLSLDEPYSLRYINRSFGDMLAYIAQEYRMPLYYLAAWPIYAVTSSVFLLKLFSVALGMLSVLGVFWVGNALRDGRTGMLAALLLAVHPVHLAYSQYVREYSMFILLFTVSMALFVKALRGTRKQWLLLTAANSLLFLTHFFSLLLITSQAVALLIVRRQRAQVLRVLLHGCGVLAVSLPWLLFLFWTVEPLGIGEFVRPFDGNPLRIGYAFYKFAIGVNVSGFLRAAPAALAVGLPFFAALSLLAIRHALLRGGERGRIMLVTLFLPVLLLFGLSATLKESLFIYRYVSPVLVLYVTLIAAYLASLVPTRRWLLVGATLVLYLVADVYYFSIITLPDWPARFGI